MYSSVQVCKYTHILLAMVCAIGVLLARKFGTHGIRVSIMEGFCLI